MPVSGRFESSQLLVLSSSNSYTVGVQEHKSFPTCSSGLAVENARIDSRSVARNHFKSFHRVRNCFHRVRKCPGVVGGINTQTRSLNLDRTDFDIAMGSETSINFDFMQICSICFLNRQGSPFSVVHVFS